MLTVFTIPKPFRGHVGVIQNNAVQSWLLLRPEPEVILFGNDEGIAEAAHRLGAHHIPDIECNEFGTPLLDSVFGIAQDKAKYPIVCYANADIILLSDFLPAIRQVQKQSFLLVGQRWDTDIKEPADFKKPDWEANLRTRVTREGKLHPPSGIDYFVFPRGLYRNIPPFAVGRTAWDNWLIYQARAMKAPVIDATKVVTAIHQNHDYSHNAAGSASVWKGPESKRNVELMGSMDRAFTLDHATLLLTPRGIRRALQPRYLYFRLEAVPVLFPRLHCFSKPMRALTRLIGRIRSGLGITKS